MGRQEERRHLCNLIQSTHMPQSRMVRHPLQVEVALIRELLEQRVTIDRQGHEAVDGDALGPELDCRSLAELADPPFGSAVGT